MKKVLFVINTLGGAGAEKALLELLKRFSPQQYEIDLYVLLDQGELIGQVPEYVNILNTEYLSESVLSVEGIFERLHEMIPFDETLLAFYEEPELLEEFFQKMADYKIESCQKIFDNYGRVDGVLYHDDWGTQRSGFFSNEMFRAQIMPSTSRFLKYVKDQGKFIELHSCGKNVQYVPEMIEMGIDMWTPQAVINDPDLLYEKYGDQMTFAFWLNIDPKADEPEIRKIIRDFVDHFGAKGRCMPCIMTDMSNPKQSLAAHDELYNYSLEYYNKLYNR